MRKHKSGFAFQKRQFRLSAVLPFLYIAGGGVGILSSFVLTIDKMRLAENAHFTPACNLNPVISCGSVMASHEGQAFGFPNPWIGLVAFSIVVTVGVSMLARATFARWFWLVYELGLLTGTLFAYWLLYVSVYTIKALCPYCLAVDVVVTMMMWYTTLYVIRSDYLKLPRRLIGIADFCRRYHYVILLVWFLIIIALIISHFWYYYGRFF